MRSFATVQSCRGRGAGAEICRVCLRFLSGCQQNGCAARLLVRIETRRSCNALTFGKGKLQSKGKKNRKRLTDNAEEGV